MYFFSNSLRFGCPCKHVSEIDRKTETNVTIKRHPKQHNYATETRAEIFFNRLRFDVADRECEKKRVLLFRNE